MNTKDELSIRSILSKPFVSPAGEMPNRYRKMLKNLRVVMLIVSLVPLTLMTFFAFSQYRKVSLTEAITLIDNLAIKTRHSFQLFLEERLNLLRLIASMHDVSALCDNKTLEQILNLLRSEFGGFVDLGLIKGDTGVQVTYAGPYDLRGKEYIAQEWFQEVLINGSHISNVFLGYRKFPHFSMSVLKRQATGESWILRATFNTSRFEEIIASMGLGPDIDAFVLNKEGILQTRSKVFGDILNRVPFEVPTGVYMSTSKEYSHTDDKDYIIRFCPITNTDFSLVVVIPKALIMKKWVSIRTDMLITYLVSLVIILFVIFRITDTMVRNLMESDRKREMAFRELEHSHKLSSIGRLAAGVAHEINNPLSIINEKAGLIMDLMTRYDSFPEKDKFLKLIAGIKSSVERCKTITHRLLGFAKKMDVTLEKVDLNSLIKEVIDFVAKEAMYKNVSIDLQLDEKLPSIYSDRGQLQQVFLNILTNAIQAITGADGTITVTTWVENPETVGVAIKDNGVGMSEETLRHIFEPFFTTKKGYGTGLGLPITYGIVTKLGGDIRVESKEGVGSTFYVYLPIKSKEGASYE